MALKHWHAVNWWKVFYLQEGKVFLQSVDDELSALARLTFYENLLIGQETSVVVRINGCPIKQVEFLENELAFPRDKNNCTE